MITRDNRAWFVLKEIRKLFDGASLEKMLYERAGLLGLSGISDDLRVLQEINDPCVIAAVEYFAAAMTKYAGAYAAVLGGQDAFVFTAGIGVPVRAALCTKLAWLDVKLDEHANMSGGLRISATDSGVSVLVLPNKEELMIAQHTLHSFASRRAERRNTGHETQ